MTEGGDFYNKLESLLDNESVEIKYFRKSLTAPASIINTENIEDEESDYEIKLWLNPIDKTAYYYAEPEKVYLNADSSQMFFLWYGEQKIKNFLELDLSGFNTSNVTNMGLMFYSMTNLVTLDLSNFNTSKVTNMNDMFSFWYGDRLKDKLEKIYVNNDFDTTNLTDFSEMFENRKKLRGGNGSFLTNPSTADKSWLRIDDPANGRPGYFTRKS